MFHSNIFNQLIERISHFMVDALDVCPSCQINLRRFL